ncbi:hypothetical protein OG689_07335 [Kitasatospora sp. NBC_00240]|uniref:hypothetical protein n=1 Tax=Kitasatospora sp. NBC_00240 TaxID=2903567 RepID=UPI00224D3F15|nr:hypothetical protein [Kitasatospora sp. NBC_00240]MCX5209099.1 hypothetical protein [Kitasatospora sp. NBC_00240]
MIDNDWANERLNQDLQFLVVSSPPRYASETDHPVEYVAAVAPEGHVTGYLWWCDADGAAAFARRLAVPSWNAGSFWYSKLLEAKARNLLPSQAVREFLLEPGTGSSGRLDPASRAVTGLAALTELAAEGWQPPGDRVKPLGWRPDPPLSHEQSELAQAAGGWLYQTDPGYDPAGQVPPQAVTGAWQVGPAGRLLRFWHNPVYGTAPAPVAPADAGAPVPPLRAGRRPAGVALLGWLEDGRAPRLCRVAGSSGSGRTHLLHWLTAAAPPDNPRAGRRVHAALSAEGLTVRSATWLLAARLGLVAGTPTDLMEALQDGVPRTLAITDLDRAGGEGLPDAAERIAVELLTPLLRVPWLRLVVESGSGTPAALALDAAAPGGAVLDLDEPRWTEVERFTAWYGALGGDPVTAGRVHPSPGLAQLAARTPATPGDPGAAPADRASALAAAWWTALPADLRPAVRSLAADGPATAELWAALPGSGGPEAVRRTTELLAPPADGRTWRLRPDQLAARVVAESPPVDHAVLVRNIADGVPRLDTGRPDLASAGPERLGALLRHAVPAGIAGQLLADPEFLVHADRAAVTAAFERAEAAGDPPGALAEAWQLAGPVCADGAPAARAAALHAWLAGRDQQAADRCAALSGVPWTARWSYRRPNGQVRRAMLGHGRYAGRLAVAVNGILRHVDPATGQDAAKVDPIRLPGFPTVAMLCGADGSYYLLRPDGVVTELPLPGSSQNSLSRALDWATRNFPDGVTALATHGEQDGPATVAVGDGGGRLHRLRTDGGPVLSADGALHRGAVTAVDVAVPAGGEVVVSGGRDGRVWSWAHAAGRAPELVDERDHPVTAVAVAGTARGPVTVAAWSDGLVRIRRPDAVGPALDLRLGGPARSVTVDPTGLVCLALPKGVIALSID